MTEGVKKQVRFLYYVLDKKCNTIVRSCVVPDYYIEIESHTHELGAPVLIYFKHNRRVVATAAGIYVHGNSPLHFFVPARGTPEHEHLKTFYTKATKQDANTMFAPTEPCIITLAPQTPLFAGPVADAADSCAGFRVLGGKISAAQTRTRNVNAVPAPHMFLQNEWADKITPLLVELGARCNNVPETARLVPFNSKTFRPPGQTSGKRARDTNGAVRTPSAKAPRSEYRDAAPCADTRCTSGTVHYPQTPGRAASEPSQSEPSQSEEEEEEEVGTLCPARSAADAVLHTSCVSDDDASDDAPDDDSWSGDEGRPFEDGELIYYRGGMSVPQTPLMCPAAAPSMPATPRMADHCVHVPATPREDTCLACGELESACACRATRDVYYAAYDAPAPATPDVECTPAEPAPPCTARLVLAALRSRCADRLLDEYLYDAVGYASEIEALRAAGCAVELPSDDVPAAMLLSGDLAPPADGAMAVALLRRATLCSYASDASADREMFPLTLAGEARHAALIDADCTWLHADVAHDVRVTRDRVAALRDAGATVTPPARVLGTAADFLLYNDEFIRARAKQHDPVAMCVWMARCRGRQQQ